jgi:quercetin dioxygenase-like cupin family protein
MKETIIDNTYRGEQIEFIQPGNEGTHIEYYHYMFWQGSGFLQEHIHPDHDEVFEVIKGKAIYYVNGKKYKAGTGSVIRIPKGKKHINPFNADMGELIIKKRDRIDLDSENFYRSLYRMADKGRFSHKGIPNKIQCLALSCFTHGKTVFTIAPLLVQKPLRVLFGGLLLKQVG